MIPSWQKAAWGRGAVVVPGDGLVIDLRLLAPSRRVGDARGYKTGSSIAAGALPLCLLPSMLV